MERTLKQLVQQYRDVLEAQCAYDRVTATVAKALGETTTANEQRQKFAQKQM
jgi:hypothetical protein